MCLLFVQVGGGLHLFGLFWWRGIGYLENKQVRILLLLLVYNTYCIVLEVFMIVIRILIFWDILLLYIDYFEC